MECPNHHLRQSLCVLRSRHSVQPEHDGDPGRRPWWRRKRRAVARRYPPVAGHRDPGRGDDQTDREEHHHPDQCLADLDVGFGFDLTAEHIGPGRPDAKDLVGVLLVADRDVAVLDEPGHHLAGRLAPLPELAAIVEVARDGDAHLVRCLDGLQVVGQELDVGGQGVARILGVGRVQPHAEIGHAQVAPQQTVDAPLVADMSSDIGSMRRDFEVSAAS